MFIIIVIEKVNFLLGRAGSSLSLHFVVIISWSDQDAVFESQMGKSR